MSIDTLKNDLRDLDARLAGLRAKIKPLQQEVSRIELERQELLRAIEAALKEPRVSDHAVIRYLERKYGFSFDAVRAEILTADRIAAINAGAKSIKHEGVSFLVRDKTITTVIETGRGVAA